MPQEIIYALNYLSDEDFMMTLALWNLFSVCAYFGELPGFFRARPERDETVMAAE